MSLSDTTHKFIEKRKLFSLDDKLLLAVSGGIDSMVMLHLLQHGGYHVEVAHVNYKLRAESSQLDEDLIQSYCLIHKIPLHIYSVDAQEQNQLAQGNIQAVARDIRYKHFHDVLERRQLDFICTAHHLEDRIETFFLNLMRGSGLKGLSSIQAISNLIRRPLLEISREKVIKYALTHDVPHREDQSNLTDKYNRNYIRHNVIPPFKERWPDAAKSIGESTDLIEDSNALLTHFIARNSSGWLDTSSDNHRLGPLSEIRKIPGAKTLLHELLKPYHVSAGAIARLIEAGMIVGSIVESKSHKIIMDRDYIIISKDNHVDVALSIPETGSYKLKDDRTISLTSATEAVYNNDPYVQYVDSACAKYPMQLRTWQEGDRISPMGMKGRSKLVSDILSDAKVDMITKQSVQVLIDSEGVILWVIGYRISDICKITAETTEMMNIRLN